MKCYSCHKELGISDKISFREDCPFCRSDLHVCKQCEFYDVKVYNECRETNAERVIDKEKANYCEYFKISTSTNSSSELSDSELARLKLEALFKK